MNGSRTFYETCLFRLSVFVFLSSPRIMMTVKSPIEESYDSPSTRPIFFEQLGYCAASRERNYAWLPEKNIVNDRSEFQR